MKEYPLRGCIVCGSHFFPKYAADITCSHDCAMNRKKLLKSEANKKHYEKMKNLKSDFEAAKLRIAELERQASQSPKNANRANSNAIAELQKKNRQLEMQLASANKKLEELQIALGNASRLAEERKVELESLKKSCNSHGGAKTIEDLVDPARIQECKRLRVKGLHLPCGQRPECWNGKPCEKTAGMDKDKMFSGRNFDKDLDL